MITNFQAQSANERTYLAWIRTGIAVLIFGFVVEKFDLCLDQLALALAATRPTIRHHETCQPISAFLVAIGVGVILLSTWRFAEARRAIDSDSGMAGMTIVPIVALAALLAIAGLALLLSILRII